MIATINRKTRKGEPETGTDGASQTWQNARVDGYGYGFGPPRNSGSGFWTGLEPNRTIFPVQTKTAGGLPGPVANTTYAWKGNYSCSVNVEHLYRMMPSPTCQPLRSLVVRNVGSLANHQNQQKCGPRCNSQRPPAKTQVSVPAGERDSTQAGSSVASTIQGQNSTASSSLNNSRVADNTECVTSAPSTTQER